MKTKKWFLVLSTRFKVNLGFTLLELVVVMAVIALLSTIGLNSYGAVQKRARDAKRKTDIRAVQSALEQYYSACGYNYPPPVGNFYNSINCASPPISIMPTVPIDPKPPTLYYCQPPMTNCTNSRYTICAALEADTAPSFCVSNQQ